MDKVSVLLPLISVWKLLAKIDNYWLAPVAIKIVKEKRYNVYFLQGGEIIKPGRDELVSNEPPENLIGLVDIGIFACLYKDRFNPDFLNDGFCFRPIRTTINYFVSPMGGSVVDLLWQGGTWTISDDDQVGFLPPFSSVAKIFEP